MLGRALRGGHAADVRRPQAQDSRPGEHRPLRRRGRPHGVTTAPGIRRLVFADGTSAAVNLLAYVPPHRARAVSRQAGLIGGDGWAPVDRHALVTRVQGVYAIGDVTGIPRGMGKPRSKAGTFAHRQVAVGAQNIGRAITGRGTRARFDGYGECCIGAADGKAALGRGDFYAEPNPQVKAHRIGLHRHAGKILLERDWLRRWL